MINTINSKNKALVSIVYATYNRKTDILSALEDLKKQTYNNFEIIVVDNGSKDGTSEAIKTNFPTAKIIGLKENLGCPAGRNIGIREANGEFIMTLDDDAISEPTLIERGATILRNNPDIGIVSGKILTHGTNQIESWDKKWSTEFIDNSFFTYIFQEGCSLIRKKVFDEVGVYPENFFIQFENRDLGNRVIDAGYKILYYPPMIIYHKGNPKSTSEFFYAYRNSLYLYIKQYPYLRLFKYASALTGLYIYKFLKVNKIHLLPKAWYEVIKESKQLFKQRKVLKKSTIKEIDRLRKCVNNLNQYYSKIAFK